MSVDRVIHSVRLVDPSAGPAPTDGAATDAAWLAFDAGRIVGRGMGDGWLDLAPRDAYGGEGGWLAPGFVDIHGHGGGGFAFDDGAAAIVAARALHRAHGTTRAVISLVAAPISDLVGRARVVADLAASDATILGSHLEGPFLDPAHRGAHAAASLRHPDPASVDALLAAGRVAQVTIAPELPGALDAIRRIVAAGAVAAIGHTDAGYDTVIAAINAGATVLTHAFNAMPGIHHRAPGPVVAALHDRRVTLELVADGVHVAAPVMRLVMDAAPGRIALVTDAMAAAGAGDGRYALGGRDVDVVDGVARALDDGSLAGSTLTQDAAVRRIVAECGVPVAEAIAAATTVPARAIGRPDLGTLATGAAADAVLLSGELEVRAVWVDGALVTR